MSNLTRSFFTESEENIKRIETLLHFRWCSNIYGISAVAKVFNLTSEKAQKIKSLFLSEPQETFKITRFLNSENQDDELSEIDKKGREKIKPLEDDWDYDYYDYYDYKDNYRNNNRSSSHSNALEKNAELIYQLQVSRDNFLGIGTNKAKRRLNKLSETNPIALAFRVALETEDKNIQAKNSFGKYKRKIYDQKAILIEQMLDLFKKNNWTYGLHEESTYDTNAIAFFEIPGCEQISWHCTLRCISSTPKYEKMWDGKINSTLEKLESAIKSAFPEIIY